MKYGYVKINREIMDKCYYTKSEYIHLLLHLKLKASFKDTDFLLGNKIVKLKRGQFITGREKLAIETGINESKIERILKVLVSDGEIEQQTNKKNRVITILSDDIEFESEQQMNNKRTTDEQLVNSSRTVGEHNQESIIKINNVNNGEKGNNESFSLPLETNSELKNPSLEKEKKVAPKKEKANKQFIPPTVSEVENYFIEKGYKKESGKKAWEFYDAGDWFDSKGNAVKNWKQKMQGVWFKDENKATTPYKPQQVGDNAIDTILNG